MRNHPKSCAGCGSGGTGLARRARLAGGAGLVLCLGVFAGAANVHAAANCRIDTDPSPAVIQAGGSVTFSGQVTGKPPRTFDWTFPGGSPSTSTAETVTVSYAGGGSFAATLNGASDRDTCTASVPVTVSAAQNNPPVCTIDTPATDVTIQVGASVNYSGTVTDPDGDPVQISWVFNGGAPGTSSAEDPGNVTYGTTGTFTTTLDATDNNGGSCAQQTRTITVQPVQQQVCNIGVDPTELAFGDVDVNASASQSTTVSNTGDAACNVTITQTGSTDFAAAPLTLTLQPGISQNIAVTYTPTAAGADNGNLAVGSNDPDTPNVDVALSGNGVANVVCVPADPNGISINSTSQSGCPDGTVPQVAQVLNSPTKVLAINDLGMHCGDLDTRIASILPPFQVMLAQVIQQGASPVLNPAGVNVFYSAASNPNDPGLSLAQDGLNDDGTTFKTNFWDFPVVAGTYDAFYPAFDPFNPAQNITPLAGPPFNIGADTGLPVPNVEDFFIGPDGQVNSGDEFLSAVTHAMPGIAAPYSANDPQRAEEHYADKPFFVNFPFGYVAADVNWYEGAGIPFAAFDDNGRENAYPLVRVEAKNAAGQTLSTVDTVLPISGEASCVNCHADPDDLLAVNGTLSRSSGPTDALVAAGLPVALSLDDPDNNLPPRVSLEYAGDINILRLHDLEHGAGYVAPSPADDGSTVAAPCDITNGPNGDANCLTAQALDPDNPKPVVCQVCHYTPALDLAHLGPLTGPEGGIANGRNQTSHSSNSNVMHSHHGATGLFPAIPAPVQQADGTITNQGDRLAALEDSCYQCHPGTNVQCLRGAMFNGGMLCSDCHGTMEQVGNDFSAGVSPSNPGAFVLDQGNFYDPASSQPRVPWANEPGCGSCHTGDVGSNLAGDPGTVVNTADTFGNTDGIRLRVAYNTLNNPKAVPIVPTNKRFAEPAVPASFNGFANPGAGNPQLYRVSTGHGGVMCEGCHGATHAEWPNANPNSNDNITANQLQGHTGTIIECSTCHGTAMNGQITLNGPHGMHPVGNDTTVSSGSAAGPRISFVDGGHERIASTANCSGCHGPGSRGSNQGTVLSVAKKDRRLDGQLIPAGTPIGCSICH
jgi:hypothetical protein